MKQYLRLREMIFNQPLICTPEYAETVMAVLGERIGVDEKAFSISSEAKDQEGTSVVNGVYKLPIVGSMVHRGSAMDAASGINSYEGIQSKIQAALDDPKVKGILLEMDSPGGSVAGAFDLRDFIIEAKSIKPIYSYAKDTMASAAYLIGSACDKVYTSQTGNIGSIGVVAMHVDQSDRDKAMGIKPTFVFAGKMKTAGNPHEALEGEALSYLQESVNSSYDMFVNAVADARGIGKQTIRDTEARVYRGDKAVELGLADGVKSIDAVMEELASNGQSGVLVKQNSKGMRMETDVENLQAALDAKTTEMSTLQATHESLQASVIAAGYTITGDGINREEEAVAPEMIEVAGVMTDKASMPEHVVAALEANAKEKADAELKEAATTAFPNFGVEAAVTIFAAISNTDEVAKEVAMSQLKAADAAFSDLQEEAGEASNEGEMSSAKEQLAAMISEYATDNSVDTPKATAAVIKTADGRELYNKAMKENT